MDTSRITAAITAAIALAACGSGATVDEAASASPSSSVTAVTSADSISTTNPSVAPTTTDGVLIGIAPPSAPAERVEWAATIVAVVNQLQVERAAEKEQFNEDWVPNEFGYDAQRALYESDAADLRAALNGLPAPLTDEVADIRFSDFVDATTAVLADAQRITNSLTDREAELRSTERTPQGLSPEIDAILNGHHELVQTWQAACFELQAFFADMPVDTLDCVGTQVAPLPGEANSTGFDRDDVSIAVECIRGDSLDELPFDRSFYDFLATRASDTSWIRTVVTITNSSDQRILVDPNFLVRWFTAADETIVSTNWLEPFTPSLSAWPGQTTIRTSYSFEGNLVIAARDNLPEELLEQVFNTAAGCEIIDVPAISIIASDEFIDADIADFVEQTECRPDDATGRWRVGYRVTNPRDVPIRVTIAAELVDENGDRRGTGGGGENTQIAPGATVESAGWSVYYTIDDVDAVERCELLSVKID